LNARLFAGIFCNGTLFSGENKVANRYANFAIGVDARIIRAVILAIRSIVRGVACSSGAGLHADHWAAALPASLFDIPGVPRQTG
jgi:hypothetical protein